MGLSSATSNPSDPKIGGSSVERHTWLEAARVECTRLLAEVKCTVPDNVRITIGFPSTGGRGKRIGECVFPPSLTDEFHEVFVSPRLDNSVDIMGVLIHELIHTAVGLDAKHGKAFKDPAVAVGLEGKMTATAVGDRLRATFETWIAATGQYPGGAINLSAQKKQKTRLLKAECETCGYICRVTAKWVDDVGPPHCPDHGAMTVEGMSETDPTDDSPIVIDEPEDEDVPDLGGVTDFSEGEGMSELSPGSHSDVEGAGYTAEQDDPPHVRREYFGASERAAAEAKARQWSKTGTEKMAHVRAIKGGEEVGYKAFHGGLAGPSNTGEYPLSSE